MPSVPHPADTRSTACALNVATPATIEDGRPGTRRSGLADGALDDTQDGGIKCQAGHKITAMMIGEVIAVA